MENKFKVGDLVKGNESSKFIYARTNCDMTKGIVTGIDRSFNTMTVKILEHKLGHGVGKEYDVSEKWFDFFKEPDSVKIFRNSKATVCEIKSEGKRLSKGVAKCCPEDEYEFIQGSKIALDRAEANLTS